MCRPLLLLSDASSTRAGARCLHCRQTCHRCGEYGLHERTSATSWAHLNGITCHGGTDPRPHLEPLPAPWAAHHPVTTFESHASLYSFVTLSLEFRRTLKIIARILREMVNRVKLGDHHPQRGSRGEVQSRVVVNVDSLFVPLELCCTLEIIARILQAKW